MSYVKYFISFACSIFLFFLFVIPVYGDGALIIPIDNGRPSFGDETGQQAYINYANGREKMVVSIDAKTPKDRDAVWIFPVPANPDKVIVDVLDDLPSLNGESLYANTSHAIGSALKSLISTQIYPYPIFWFFEQPWRVQGGLGGGEMYQSSLLQSAPTSIPAPVTVYEHIEKGGMTSEIITAKTSKGFFDYVHQKGFDIKPDSLPIVKSYIGKNYSFIVSWFAKAETKPEEQGSAKIESNDFHFNNVSGQQTREYGKITNPANIRKSDKVTFSAWIKTDSISSDQPIVGGPGGDENIYQDVRLSNGGRFSVYLKSLGTLYTPPLSILPGQSYHVAFSYDGTTKELKLYVNGKQGVYVIGGIDAPSYGSVSEIGANNSFSSNFNFNFNGNIEDPRFYEEVLSADDIAKLYKHEEPGIIYFTYNFELQSQSVLDAPEQVENSSQLIKKAVFVTFPSEKIYFPLLLTSVYGSKIVPATIHVIGHIMPKLYDDIKDYAQVEYYTNGSYNASASLQNFYRAPASGSVKFTKIKLNPPSKLLSDDLWMDQQSPAKIFYFDVITDHPVISFLLLLLLLSAFTGFVVGMILFPQYRTLRGAGTLALFGSANIFTLAGVVIASVFALQAKPTEEVANLLSGLRQKHYILRRRLAAGMFWLGIPFTALVLITNIWYGNIITNLLFLLGCAIVFSGFWLKKIALEDKYLFDNLKMHGYSSWHFGEKKQKRILFLCLFSVCFIILSFLITWGISSLVPSDYNNLNQDGYLLPRTGHYY